MSYQEQDADDDIPEIPVSQTVGLKVERTLMAFLYCVMLCVACTNVWKYLIKKKMWKSFPLTIAYIILVVYCIICIVYELYMSIACGYHDCLAVVIALDHDYNSGDEEIKKHFKDVHEQIVRHIFFFWRLKLQL